MKISHKSANSSTNNTKDDKCKYGTGMLDKKCRLYIGRATPAEMKCRPVEMSLKFYLETTNNDDSSSVSFSSSYSSSSTRHHHHHLLLLLFLLLLPNVIIIIFFFFHTSSSSSSFSSSSSSTRHHHHHHHHNQLLLLPHVIIIIIIIIVIFFFFYHHPLFSLQLLFLQCIYINNSNKQLQHQQNLYCTHSNSCPVKYRLKEVIRGTPLSPDYRHFDVVVSPSESRTSCVRHCGQPRTVARLQT